MWTIDRTKVIATANILISIAMRLIDCATRKSIAVNIFFLTVFCTTIKRRRGDTEAIVCLCVFARDARVWFLLSVCWFPHILGELRKICAWLFFWVYIHNVCDFSWRDTFLHQIFTFLRSNAHAHTHTQNHQLYVTAFFSAPHYMPT